MLLHLNFNFTRTVCCCSLDCNGSGSDWIVSLVDPYKVPQAQTEMDGFLAGCNDVYKPSVPGWSTPFNYFSSTVAAGRTSFEFSYVHSGFDVLSWAWGKVRTRAVPQGCNKLMYFKLICQVIEPTDQRFNIKEQRREGNHLSLRIFATTVIRSKLTHCTLHLIICCTHCIVVHPETLLTGFQKVSEGFKEKNRKSIGEDFFRFLMYKRFLTANANA